MNAITTMHEDQLREGFAAFWNEQLKIRTIETGLVISPPLMYSDGWQVILYLEQITPAKWLVHDQGATLMILENAGSNLGKEKSEKLDAHMRFYQIERDGLQLQKVINDPGEVVELQIFAEALVAISHMVPRTPPKMPLHTDQLIEDRVNSFFYHRNLQPKRRHKLQGQVEREIVVDYYIDAEVKLALQTVTRSTNLLPYMEQWGWRWTDLKLRHPDIQRAMVYDPDNQIWDESSLSIGREVCEIFVPYTQTEEAIGIILPA